MVAGKRVAEVMVVVLLAFGGLVVVAAGCLVASVPRGVAGS
jgi:hypothetical protein